MLWYLDNLPQQKVPIRGRCCASVYSHKWPHASRGCQGRQGTFWRQPCVVGYGFGESISNQFCSPSSLWIQLRSLQPPLHDTRLSLLPSCSPFVLLFGGLYILKNSNVYSTSRIVDLDSIEGQWGLPKSLFCLTKFFCCIDLVKEILG